MLEKTIQWFSDRLNKVYYSMDYRNGQTVNGRPNFDCSSAVYYALVSAGYLPSNAKIGNTDSLYGDLEKNGFTKLQPSAQGDYDTRRGDIFLWGKRGASSGGAGHTGIFTNANDIIHCNYGYNGITVNNYDWLRGVNGYPEQTFYRYTGASYTPPSIQGSPTDQVLEIGSTIKFENIYVANDVQLIGGIWQVRSNALCKSGFTWDDNGIPAEPLVEVDIDGYRTPDQSLDINSPFKIPGKFTVLDLGESDGMWLALIEWSGLRFWVDVESATEITPTDAGTAVPSLRPPTAPPPSPVVVPPAVQEPEPIPTTPVIVTPPTIPEEPKPQPPITNPKEDKPMAFTDEQQTKLNVQSESYLGVAGDVASQNTEITDGVSKKVKLAVYIIGDTLLGLGAVTPQIVVLINTQDPFIIATTLSSLFATTGLFLLTMFGIYRAGKK